MYAGLLDSNTAGRLDSDSASYLTPGLDIGPAVQEHLDDLQMTKLSSYIESGGVFLSETQQYLLFQITNKCFLSEYAKLQVCM